MLSRRAAREHQRVVKKGLCSCAPEKGRQDRQLCPERSCMRSLQCSWAREQAGGFVEALPAEDVLMHVQPAQQLGARTGRRL